MSNGKKKNPFLSFLMNLFLVLIFLTGAGILFYPMISNYWNQYRNNKLISSYSEVVNEIKPEDFSGLWDPAIEYNKNHRVNVISDGLAKDEASSEGADGQTETETEIPEEDLLSEEYKALLDPAGNGIMGYIEIPKINVKLAVYHGVGPNALEKGCGHIEGTSLPIGGESTHSVLSAHRGLPSAKLFTDLDQIKKGDKFSITILDQTFMYRVDQIKEVLPSEISDLDIVEGKDYCTLVTCTPYGVNTHRLLVRGERIVLSQTDDPEAEAESETEVLEAEEENLVIFGITIGLQEKMLAAGLGVFLVVVILLAVIFRKKK